MKTIAFLKHFFLLMLTMFSLCLSAQNWKYAVGWSLSYTYGEIDGKKTMNPNDYSMLKAEAGLSTNWPLRKSETGLSLAENILRLGIYSVGIERRFNNRWSAVSGLEIGGRSVNITEYAQNGRSGGRSEEYLANYARRSFLVCSLPLLLKYKVYARKIDYALMGGVYLNESFSKAAVTPFYTTPKGSFFYPSLSLGVRISPAKARGFSFECAYQQGLAQAMSDEVTVGSAAVVNWEAQQLSATSMGSHFRVGISYTLPCGEKKQQKGHSFIPFEERRLGKVIRIKTVSDTFQLCFQDNKIPDEDSIRIVLNGSGMPQTLELVDTPQCIDFDVHRQLVNTIDIHTVNEGKVKPNTMSVTYYDHKRRKKVLMLNNSMDAFIRIKVIYLK